MKNVFKVLGITTLVAVIIFSMAACNKNRTQASEEQKTPEAVNNGSDTQLRLSNVPVTVTGAFSSYDFGYTATGLGEISTLSDLFTGTPKAIVNNGKLTLELDVPKSNFGEMQQLIYMFYSGISATPNDAKGYRPSFDTSNLFDQSTNSYSLSIKGPDQGNNVNGAFLIYVDKDVTMNGSSPYYNFDNIFLAKGWNFLTYTYSNEINYIKTASQTLPAGYVWTVVDNGIFKPPRDDIVETTDELYGSASDYEKLLKGDLSGFIGRWENNTGESRTLRADGTFADGQTASGFTTQTMTNGGTYYMWGVHTSDGGGFGVMLFPIATGIMFGNEFYQSDKGKVRIMMGQDLDASQIFYLK